MKVGAQHRYETKKKLFFAMLFGLGLLALWALPNIAAAQTVWSSDDYTLYDTITIDAANIDEDLTDFPVYVDLADLSTTFWSTTPAASSTVGTDIRVTTNDGSPVELPRELVFASSTLETGELHFKANSISSTTDTVFRIYYNGTTTGDYATSSTYGAQNVWTNDYAGVWHFNNDPSSSLVFDSTSNANDATSFGSMTETDLVSAQVGQGLDFDGVDDYVDFDIPGLWFGDPNLEATVSMWRIGTGTIDFGTERETTSLGDAFLQIMDDGRYRYRADHRISPPYYADASSTVVVATTTWSFVSFAADGPNDLYNFNINGSTSTDSVSFNYDSVSEVEFDNYEVGRRRNASFGTAFHTLTIDELRVASTSRSNAWISAEYINQATSTEFYAVTPPAAASEDWNSTDYTLYDTITIDAANIDEDLTDFPVYVDLADLSTTFWSTTPAASSTVGTDIRVTTNDGSPVELPRELVFASSTLETGELHFKANSISSTTDTVFRIYYNGTTTGDYARDATYGSENVWTNGYVGVWHLQQDPSGTTTDSTSFRNDGTSGAGLGSENSAVGQLGAGVNFDGTMTDYINFGNDSSVNNLSEISVCAWSQYDSLPTTYYPLLTKSDAGFSGWDFYVEDTPRIGFLTPLNDYKERNSNATAGQWRYLCGVWNGSEGNANIFLYSNGVQVTAGGAASNSGGTLDDSTHNLYTGAYESGSPSNLNGRMDEIRLASTTRSAAWLSAEYVNQATTTDFYSTTPPLAITVSGALYSDVGVTEITTSKTLALAVGGEAATVLSTTTDSGAGTYSFLVPQAYLNAASGTPLLIYVDGDGSTRAAAVTKIASTTANISGVDLYQDTVIVRQEGSTSTGVTDLAAYDSTDDADVQFTASTTLDSLTLLSGQDLYVWDSSVFTAPSTTLSGSYTSNGTTTGKTITLTGSGETIGGTGALGSIAVAGTYTSVDSQLDINNLTITVTGNFTAPVENLVLSGVFTQNGSFDAGTGTTTFTGGGGGDVTTLFETAEEDISNRDTAMYDLAIAHDGSKLFTVGFGNDRIYEFTFGAPYDLDTLSYTRQLSVSGVETTPTTIEFAENGSTMYMGGFISQKLYQYTLSTPYNISTASLVASTTPANTGGLLAAEILDDGKRLHVDANDVAGTRADYYTYSFGTPYDISTLTFTGSTTDPAILSGSLRSLQYADDGLTLYATDSLNDRMLQFTLSTPFDQDTATLDSTVPLPNDIKIASALEVIASTSQLFLLDLNTGTIHSFDIGAGHNGNFVGDNSFANVSITDGVSAFVSPASTTALTVASGATAGLASTTLTVAGGITNDGTIVSHYHTPNTLVLAGGDLTSTGEIRMRTATSSRITYTTDPLSADVVASDVLRLETSGALSGSGLAASTFGVVEVAGNPTASAPITATNLSIESGGALTTTADITVDGDFINNGSYTVTGATTTLAAESYDMFAAELAAIYLPETVDVNGIAFNPDGTKMFLTDTTDDGVDEYALSTAFDITTATHTAFFAIGDNRPTGISFDDTGDTMFITGWGDDSIYAYSLSSPYSISGASLAGTRSLRTQGGTGYQITTPSGHTFSPDGSKLFIAEREMGEVVEYDVSPAFTIGGISYVRSITVPGGNNPSFSRSVYDVTFDNTGTIMYVTLMNGVSFSGGAGPRDEQMLKYELASPWNLSSPTLIGVVPIHEINPLPASLAFNSDGSKAFIGGLGGSVIELDLTAVPDLAFADDSETDFGNLAITATHPITASTTATMTDLIIGERSELRASSSVFTVLGDMTNNGTLTAETSEFIMAGTDTQIMSGTYTGSSTLFDLTLRNTSGDGASLYSLELQDNVSATGTVTLAASTSVQFAADGTYTFNDIDWAGTETEPIWLRSSASGTPWSLQVDGTQLNVEYINVQDSNATTTFGGITAASSTDAGGNCNWDFGSGTVCEVEFPDPLQEWNDTDWILYDTITIDADNIDEDLTDFPVYLNLADLSAQFWSTTPSGANIVGTDIRVTTGTSSPFELPRELVSASSIDQTGELHFKANSISSTTDTVFRIYYNGNTAGDYAATSTYGAQNVWTNNMAIVYHFDDTTDSTSNDRDRVADVGSPTATSTVLGQDLNFDGNDGWAMTNIGYWEAEYDTRVHRALFTTGADVTSRQAILAEGGGTNGVMMYIRNGSLYARWWSESFGWNGDEISQSISANTTYDAHMVFDQGDYALYVQGVSAGTGNVPTTTIGAHAGDGGIAYTGPGGKDFDNGTSLGDSDFFTGVLHELRTYDVDHGAAWYKAEAFNASTTNPLYMTIEGVAGTGSTTLTNHDAGQVDNLFSFQNVTNGELFAFKLTPETGNATVTEVTIEARGAKQINTSDFSNITLYQDNDADGQYDASDVVLDSAGVFTLDNGSVGSITFSTDFLSTTTMNYLVVADWNFPERGAQLTLDIDGSDFTAVDADGTYTIFGAVDQVQHNRNESYGGGGGSGAVGGEAPVGDGVVGGGSSDGGGSGDGDGGAFDTNEGGQLIGSSPDLDWPGANSGSWQSGANAYDQVDGTYATTSSAVTHNFTDYGHGILGSDEINGIEVRLEVSGTTAAGNIGVELSWDGGSSFTTSGKVTPTLTTTDSVVVLGGSSDLWGRVWSADELSDVNFAVRLTGAPDTNEIRLDALVVRVYHQATGGGAGGGSGPGGGAI